MVEIPVIPIFDFIVNSLDVYLILVVIFFIFKIGRLFSGLPKLVKPWQLMLVSFIFFLIHFTAHFLRAFGIGNYVINTYIYHSALVIFLIVFLSAILKLRDTWALPEKEAS